MYTKNRRRKVPDRVTISLKAREEREWEMSNEEKMTAIIGIRVYPSWKRQMMEEAVERGKTLSEYFYDLIELGWERTKEEDVKQGSENEMGTVKQR